ncbi:transcriptional regulator [Streptomyces millisiae]|uniref:Transcriptional regulator n=1 Tax=Streptomyces millisiae TaxID=3075542 RepID=A0ABU2LQT7_9ACTN|nr:transcriptional regulator [Streptomyces sp. DSM 44918]MDT0319945.1 transcriptional regulator [Streptomyces sp. DSM 44918]
MNPPDNPTPDGSLLLLHALRCVGTAGPERLRAVTGLDESDVESELIALGIEGLVSRYPGPMPGWSLTAAGRAAHAELIAHELDAAGARAAVTAAFDRFLVLNPELLDLCAAWQLRTVDGVVTANDHRDPAYDARVLAGFRDLDRRAVPVRAELAAALPRFARYEDRLAGALDRVAAGETAYLTDDLASYHTVWAEWHEDLLATLGLRR